MVSNAEEFELMKDSKYRTYISSVDKALRSFEYTSEWADLISALAKLNKVLLANMKFPVIPRRIKISKRLAQCMHPALPSGVHLKALETYDIIFKCMGTNRLSHELFIYSAGLFPLLGHAAMIVRPSLLTLYETHFVPLGERLTPALSGFLSGVLPGLEEGSDHFDRTNSLLEKVCEGVGRSVFYGCLWDCIDTNSAIRLPAVAFILSHFNKKLTMEDQIYVMGLHIDIMVRALCGAVQDSSVLVQRSTLDLLLAGFPMHNSQLLKTDMTQIVTSSLTTILRRDMSLNRRLFAWLLGSEVGTSAVELKRTLSSDDYFETYSKEILIQAVKNILIGSLSDSQDLRPYKLLVSLLDKSDIGPVILDDILLEVFRTLYCTSKKVDCSQDLIKSANLLFSALEPSYIWQFSSTLFESACKLNQSINNGGADIVEVCSLTQFLLDMSYAYDTPTEHLPLFFLKVLTSITRHCIEMSPDELSAAINLCRTILKKIQPGNYEGPTFQEDEVSLGSEVQEEISRTGTIENTTNTDSAVTTATISVSELTYSIVKSEQDETVAPTSDSLSSSSSVSLLDAAQSETNLPFYVETHIKDTNSVPSENIQIHEITDESVNSLNETTKKQHSLMSECVAQFQEFFIRLVKKRILAPDVEISDCLSRLLSKPPKDSSEHRTRELELKLKACLGEGDKETRENKKTNKASSNNPALPGPEWNKMRPCFSQVCKLLVDFSTLPSLLTSGKTPNADRELIIPGEIPKRFPPWLQILLVLCTGVDNASSLQLLTIGTFLDLLSLLRAVPTEESLTESRGVISVVIIPLLTHSHVSFIQNHTAVFQIMAELLWDSLGNPNSCSHMQSSHLLLRLHTLLPGNDVVEDVIGASLSSDPVNQEQCKTTVEAFERFSTLWHLSKETTDFQSRTLDKSLFKMLDNLKRPAGPLKLQAQSWLLQALLGGDTVRILEPLLLILLAPGTARLSVRHCTVSHASTVLSKSESKSSKIFAVTSQDNHVIYHVSEPSSLRPRGVHARRIHAVTRLATGAAKQQPPHCITETAFLKVAAEAEENQKMSVIVNPFNDVEVTDWSAEDSKEISEEGVLQEILEAVEERDNAIEASSFTTSTSVHMLHSHMLLYAQVYDSHRTLYALSAVRSLLLNSPRMFLCSTASKGVNHGSREGSALINLLARHLQAQGGRSFEGELSTEYVNAAKRNMLLEALVSSLLWFTRSYYPNLGQARLTNMELAANRQVQLAAVELLTLLLAELALLTRDGNRGLAHYLKDLLKRCGLCHLSLSLLLASVHAAKETKKAAPQSFTEEVLIFNYETEKTRPTSCIHRLPAHVEAIQVHLLRLVLALIMLEEQSNYVPTIDTTTPSLKYIPDCPVSQQPMFLKAILDALKLEHMSHLHQSWTVMLTASLPFMGSALPHVVLNVAIQICNNLEKLAQLYQQGMTKQCCLPAQYTSTQLEALTTILHYCLLDSTQTHLSSTSSVGTIQSNIPDAQPGQLISNFMSFFIPIAQQQEKEKPNQPEVLHDARRTVLNNLPRIMMCIVNLWQAVCSIQETEGSYLLGSSRSLRVQLEQFLGPIALLHTTQFLASLAVVSSENNVLKKVVVELISSIRGLQLESLVVNVQAAVKQPPTFVGIQQNLEVSLLELLLTYLQTDVSVSQLTDSWTSLLSLLRDCVTLPPPTPFIALQILSTTLHRATLPTPSEKRDSRSVHDVTTKLIESCSQLSGACLEQTTWLRRNLAVREDTSPDSQPTTPTTSAINSSYRHSLQAQNVLADLLAPLLDISFGSQDKERVVTLLTGVLANITPYLRNHSAKNASSFRACSQLLASVSGYQYTRRAWRKDALDLLLEPSFFQMELQCLSSWKTVVDNLMAHDNATFKELLLKVSVPQSGSLNLFSSKEQEFEQRAQLLKRLAFVIFCGELDQYHKHMHEIQERLADCLRLPQAVPSLQAQVFLCFRVILIRMSPQHVTSLWPVIISELVQAMLQMEHQLCGATSEQMRNQMRLTSGLDATWTMDSSNGMNGSNQTNWLALQLAACKLLNLMLVLPTVKLPQFAMYRWAFVGESDSEFVPHVIRLARLLQVPTEDATINGFGSFLIQKNSIQSLNDLGQFFVALTKNQSTTKNDECEIEKVLDLDFLESLPSK